MTDVVFKFPPNPSDGDEVMDSFGNRYRYNADSDTWIDIGLVQEPPLASYDDNGLVSPALAQRLSQIQTLGVDRYVLTKLYVPSSRPYFILFRSSDHLVKFTIEQT